MEKAPKKNIAELYESEASLILKGFDPEEAKKFLEEIRNKHGIK